MKTIKAKVHRLPTEGKGVIVIRADKPYVFMLEHNSPHSWYGKGGKYESKDHTYYHLYITTDEEIKEGDWVFETDLNTIKQAGKDYNFGLGIKHDRKIIATTDSLLSHVDVLDHHYLPWIPQSFIEEYCKAGGIHEVLVEMALDTHREGRYAGHLNGEVILYVKPDNTIIIHPVEEKMYSREEVEALCRKAADNFSNWKEALTWTKWIEENL